MKKFIGIFLIISFVFVLLGCNMFFPVRDKANEMLFGFWHFTSLPEQTSDKNLFFDRNSLSYSQDKAEDNFKSVKFIIMDIGSEGNYITCLSTKHDYTFKINVKRPYNKDYYYEAKVFVSDSGDSSGVWDLNLLSKNINLKSEGDTVSFDINSEVLSALYKHTKKEVGLTICLFSRDGNLVDTCPIEVQISDKDVSCSDEYLLCSAKEYKRYGFDYENNYIFDITSPYDRLFIEMKDGPVPEFDITMSIYEGQAKEISDEGGIECCIGFRLYSDGMEDRKYTILPIKNVNGKKEVENSYSEFSSTESNKNIKSLAIHPVFSFSAGTENHVYDYLFFIYDTPKSSEASVQNYVGEMKVRLTVNVK